jgi:hypothetical protein
MTFADVADLALFQLSTKTLASGVLNDRDAWNRIKATYGGEKDLNAERLTSSLRLKLDPKMDPSEVLRKIMGDFMLSFGKDVRFNYERSRLIFGDCVNSSAEKTYWEKDLSYLLKMPFVVGKLNDVSFIDIPGEMITSEGAIDLTPLEPLVSLGTTISFYLPSKMHRSWYACCKPHHVPPALVTRKKMTLLHSGSFGPNIDSWIYGVDVASAET